MRKRLLGGLLVCGLLAAPACAARGDRTAPEAQQAGGTTTPGGQASQKFGDLLSPCSTGKGQVEATESGNGPDRLYIGVASDKSATVRPGLLRELYDASQAFATWCNAQGGIQGLKIEIVDLDAKLFDVEKMMTKACTEVFAMVGGGHTFDNLEFSGKPESDFHECGLIDFPAFTVTPTKADSNGNVQALPNPATVRSRTFYQALARLYPDKIGKTAVVSGELDSIKFIRDQTIATLDTVDGFTVTDQVPYAVQGQDWKIISGRIKNSGATAVNFIGEPENLALLLQKMDEDDYHPLVFTEANHYDKLVLQAGKAADGLVVRTPYVPLEEADQNPATAKFLEIFDEYRTKVDSNAKLAALGGQSMSAWLLFAQAANECLAAGGGVLKRACVLESGKQFTEWTGGGLHGATNPGGRQPSPCVVLLEVRDGAFTRLFPKRGSADDNGDGLYCTKDGVVTIKGDFSAYGAGAVDPSRD